MLTLSRCASDPGQIWYKNPEVLFGVGVLAWVLAMFLHWPGSLSFGDEVGYIGQAKLFLTGRILPEPDSPGVWSVGGARTVSQYPLLVSLLLAPLFAVTPGAVFLAGLLAAIGLAWSVSRAVKAWGHDPRWGLLVLAHPTIIILSRTVMSDVILSAFAVGGWWALTRGRPFLAAVLIAATMSTKPTGFLIAGAIVVGEIVTSRADLRRRDPQALRRAGIAMVSFLAGSVVMMSLNYLAARQLWFTYDHRFLGTPPFWPKYFRSTAPLHASSVLLNPPLLIAGLLTFIHRRMFGPLFMILGLGTMMCFYFFVDYTSTWVETVVLSQRLILPAVAFLLVGYAAVLAGLAARLRVTSAATLILTIAPALLAFKIGGIHHRWQVPMDAARSAATQAAQALGSPELGLTENATKAGLLYPGPTRLVKTDSITKPAVILCATRGMSYRQPTGGEHCQFPGYESRNVADGYVLLTERPR